MVVDLTTEENANSTKNHVTFLAHKAKSLFYCHKITEAKSSKELYQIANTLSARTKSTLLPTIFPLPELPDLFSEFFVNKIKKIRMELDAQTVAAHPIGKQFRGEPLTSFLPVSEATVRKFLCKSAPKTCDLDPVPTSLLFECLDTVLPTLTEVINRSLVSGVFPDVHKVAIVKPLLKKKPQLRPQRPEKLPSCLQSFLRLKTD